MVFLFDPKSKSFQNPTRVVSLYICKFKFHLFFYVFKVEQIKQKGKESLIYIILKSYIYIFFKLKTLQKDAYITI